MSENKEQLAVRAGRSFSLLPASLGEAREMAEMIARSDFAPKDYRGKPENVIIAVQMGADLGLKPMQALQNIAVINGRPSIYGDAALALVMPALERFVESWEGSGDDLAAVCVAKRRGWPDETTRRFSIKDAKAANLWGKQGPWTQYPKRMLQFRARGFTLRDVAPDLLLGLVLAEEAGDYPEPTITGEVVHTETVATDPMERVPEPFRDRVGRAFEALNFSAAQRLAKLNECFGKDDVTADDAAVQLLRWCEDEYSKRKTGKPMKREGNGNAKSAPVATTPPPQAPSGEPVAQTHVAPSAGGIGAVPPEGTPIPAKKQVAEELF